MSRTLRIAAELELPLDAVTQTMAAIGRKGAGKTYLATLIAEQMLDAGAQVVVLDPVGNWFGLRLAADGKSKGKDIFVLGGEHGDVPLTPEGGARIARFLVEKRVSAVLDVSGFRQGERKRFAAALGEELFHLKKTQRAPMHLFLEEAQVFAPQRPGPEEARMLGAFESIIRLGRNYGIGATLVTQRPQSVNKEVLSQVECLCVLQVNGAHERKALEEWVQEAGADRKLVGQLPGLHQGEGYVWSPSWLRTFQRVRFAKKTTFDASATPELGKVAKAATLAAVDVEALRTDLAEVVKEAEADDPKALRRRVAELERVLVEANAQAERIDKKLEKVVAKPAIDPKLVARVEAALKRVEALGGRCAAGVEMFTDAATVLGSSGQELRMLIDELTKAKPPPLAAPRPALAASRSVYPGTGAARVRDDPPRAKPAGSHQPARQKILDALARLQSVGIHRADRTQLAFLADASPTSSAFANNLGALRSAGLIDYPGGGEVGLTPDGLADANPQEAPQTNEELHRSILGKLQPARAKIVSLLIAAHPEGIARTGLAEAAGASPTSSAYANNLGALRSLGLIDYRGGEVVARDLLFLGGGR